MRQFKSTLIFAFIVLLLGLASYWEFNKSEEDNLKKEEQSKALPLWDKDQVTEFKIVNEGKELHLVKKDSHWQITAPVQDEADSSSVNSMLSSMITDKLTKLEVEGNLDATQYGLNEAQRFFEFLSSSDKKKRIILSSKKTYDGKYYLKYGDSDEVYLASSTWDQWLRRSVNELRNKKIFKDEEKIKKLVITQGKKALRIENVDSQWLLDGDKNFPVDDSKINNLISSLENFRAADVSAEDQSQKSLKEHNLLNPEVKIVIDFEGDGPSRELFVSPLPKDLGDVYIYTNNRPFIYKTYKSIAEKWKVVKEDFKKKEEDKQSEKAEETESHEM